MSLVVALVAGPPAGGVEVDDRPVIPTERPGAPPFDDPLDPASIEAVGAPVVDGWRWAAARVADAEFEPGPCSGDGPGPFPDVGATHPFCTEIEWLAEEGVSGGYADGTFRPTASTTRQAMAAFLWRVEGEPPVDVPDPGEPTFADVGADHPFFEPIEWMATSGLASGTAQPDGTVRYLPGAPVSRQAMAAFLWRGEGEPAPPTVQPHFADVPAAHPFFDAVQWMAMSGLSTGSPRPGARPDYRPVDPVSRQAMAAFLFRSNRLGSVECDAAATLGQIDATVSLARLTPAGTWQVDGPTTAFDGRTSSAEVFRDRLGFDCGLRATQVGAEGERHVVAAWTGTRLAAVVQASDAPTAPYAPQALFDLLVEVARGEHLEGGTYRNPERTSWAATLAGGESIVVMALDTAMGATAKAWVADVDPGSTDHLISLPSEQFGIDTLRAVGARNVGLAELPEIGSEIGTLAAVSPTGQLLEVRVAPLGWIDPTTDWLGTGTSAQQVAGLEVWVVDGGPDDGPLSFDVAHVSFECGPWVWHVITGYGTTQEVVDFVAVVIGSLACS
ncbi:MAG: S-layer homology domain-containing protein [Acidimicrobiia bacterium]|nr:S-layer homology domain-containing protein [Acidimicrobiia bacterium]